MGLFKKNEKELLSKMGEFTVKDFPRGDRNKKFYFYEYCKPDGEWIDKDEPICKIRIGESHYYNVRIATFYAIKSGFLEWIIEEDYQLEEKMIIYKLHTKGVYSKENSLENEEYKHYFFLNKFHDCSFDSWLISDGCFVNKDDSIYIYMDSEYNEHIHKAEKSGYIDVIDPGKTYSLEKNELLYFIRNQDSQRIIRKYKNIPSIIVDDFSQSNNITWERISSKDKFNYGIISKSDDGLIDLTFTFNYLNNNDIILFHFNPRQIKPKLNDKILFLFDSGELIEFVINSNPISIRNKDDVKVLEYKSLITNTELKIFSSKDFKKWKIELVNESREILGGNKGSLVDYETEENLKIVIKKFGADYMTTVLANIADYKPLETRIIHYNTEKDEAICFVYLMHDKANGFYKIGISNKPYYREKTLQSEKPTIELIASKRFPIRKIAESIEKSLHNVYGDKRIRGEWFKLCEKDIKHIIETLK